MINLIIVLLPIVLVLFFMFFYQRVWRKKSLPLEKLYNARMSPLANLIFRYDECVFSISRASRGAGAYTSTGGSYPVLWSYVNDGPELIIGHGSSMKYARVSHKLRHKEEVDFGIRKIAFCTNDDKMISVFDSLKDRADFKTLVSFLFTQEFSHVSLFSEIHFCGLLPKKKNVLRYTCLPEGIYSKPETLREYLSAIVELKKMLKIECDN